MTLEERHNDLITNPSFITSVHDNVRHVPKEALSSTRVSGLSRLPNK